MRTLLSTLFIIAFTHFATAQFVLGEINEDWFEEEYMAEGLYGYLDNNLVSNGGMKIIKRFDVNDDPHEAPCLVGKSFEGGVYVKEDRGCEEESGSNTWVYMPSDTDIDELKEWIESWNELFVGDEHDGYTWRDDNFGPPEGEAGCYYSIEEDLYGRIVLELYCGC
ncbi:MAG: hypothetical protein HWE14_04285 [Flavobacteriia bacterium]|nr:hypothetical protein [Flavobacteriia bacterium]